MIAWERIPLFQHTHSILLAGNEWRYVAFVASSFFSPVSSKTFTLDVLVSLLRQENAVDICVIKVPEQVKYAEYFIVVSGVSPRHLRAMALYAIKVVTDLHFLFCQTDVYSCNLCCF